MSIEVRPITLADVPFIARSFVKETKNPARQQAEGHISADDKVKYYTDLYTQTLAHVQETGSDVVLGAYDTVSGRIIAYAHWVLPQDTDDPAQCFSDSFMPGSNVETVAKLHAGYRRSRKEILKGRRCFILHQLYADDAHRGSGAGSLLVRWPFDEADRQGIPVMLGTRKANTAQYVYRIHGFNEVGGYDAEMNGTRIEFLQMLREPNTTGRLTAAVLIISDTASKDASTDKAGATLKEVFETDGSGRWTVGTTSIVADDAEQIRNKIVSWTGGRAGAAASAYNLIVTTGGTGFALKDHTPEAIEPLLERKAPALVHLMLSSSLQVTPFAAMARPVAGTRGKTVIVTLPGSPKGAKENLQAILKLLPHACQQTAGADSRNLHAGGVKKLESEAGLAAGAAAATASAGAGHDHTHHHSHGHGHGHGHGGDGHGPAGPHTRPEDRPIPNDPSLGPGSRHRESPYPRLSVSEAISNILAAAPPPRVEAKHVDSALVGSIVAEDVTATHPVPAFRASIVDGYACLITDPQGTNAKGVFPVASISHAAPGQVADLLPNTLGRITTGAPLPPNAAAVVMVEDTVLRSRTADGKEEAEIEVLTDQVKPGENVREVGSDIAAGAVVLKHGTRVSAVGGELGVLASVGRATVNVYRRPVIGIMSTGDEIVPHDREAPLQLGEVRDTNRVTLMAAVRGWGFEVVDLGISKDAAGSLETALRDAVRKVDVIVTTGGVSMGELDLLKPTIERSLGGMIHFGRVAMKPGLPTTFATVPHKAANGDEASVLVFSLPGNPASGMVTAALFMRPCLDLMSGVDRDKIGMPRIKVELAEATKSDNKREEYQRAFVWQGQDGRLYGQVTGMQRSSRIGSFTSANCLLVVAPGQGVVEKGRVLEGLLLSGLSH